MSIDIRYLILILISICTTINCHTRIEDSDESCETLESEVHITKDEYDEIGRLQRTCSGDISVTKCEGFCNSQVQPSVVTTTGFSKECYCCRESYMKERLIILDQCYDTDGIKLMTTNINDGIMEIKIREPTECKCMKCGDMTG